MGTGRLTERKAEKAIGHRAEREEWINSNRGPDRARWRMEPNSNGLQGRVKN